MASAKKTVDLKGGPRRVGSRIRRDPPPPPAKKLSPSELKEREAWVIGVGITVFAVALSVLIMAFGQWTEHSPAETRIQFEAL